MIKFIKNISLAMLALLLVNCGSDDEATPILADFQFLVNEAQVTFNGTVQNTTKIAWDFGDGNTSNEEDPVHAYAAAGNYTVTLTVTNDAGDSFVETKEVVIKESLRILLTGGQAFANGKTWKIKQTSTTGDGAGLINNDLGLLLPAPDYILLGVGLGGGYEDEFTFKFDGTYKVDNKDGKSLMGLVFASIEKAADIRAVSADPANVPLADVLYTPKTDATWEVEKGDFTIETAQGPANFVGKQRFILGDYLGFKDKATNIILKDITATTMSVAIGLHTVPQAYDKPTLLLHLTLEAM